MDEWEKNRPRRFGKIPSIHRLSTRGRFVARCWALVESHSMGRREVASWWRMEVDVDDFCSSFWISAFFPNRYRHFCTVIWRRVASWRAYSCCFFKPILTPLVENPFDVPEKFWWQNYINWILCRYLSHQLQYTVVSFSDVSSCLFHSLSLSLSLSISIVNCWPGSAFF